MHAKKLLLSYLLGAQHLSRCDDLNAKDVAQTLSGSESDADVLITAFRARLECLRAGRLTVDHLIEFVDTIAESHGGEIGCDEETPEELFQEINHMHKILNSEPMAVHA